MRVLYTGQEIRKEVQRILARTSERRVAVVAFIGRRAPAHLPKPKGLEVYCWPRAGGTSASAVTTLLKSGASVYFADRMHAKVYWAERSGAVITSANLSDNAFGSGDLHEAGVALASSQLDIERLISSIGASPATPEALEKLRREEAIERSQRTGRSAKPTIPSFEEWYDGRGGLSWKWDYWDSFGGGVSKRARNAVKEIHPDCIPQEYIYCNRGTLKEEDWVLRVKKGRTGILMSPEWVYVERVVLVGRNDKVYDPEYPFQAVQARERRHCPAPPFAIDKGFRAALRCASASFGLKNINTQVESRSPTSSFLKRVRNLL